MFPCKRQVCESHMLSSTSGRNQSTFFLAGRQRLQLTQTLIITRLNKLLELTTDLSGRPSSADLLTPFRFVSLKVFTYISSFDPPGNLRGGHRGIGSLHIGRSPHFIYQRSPTFSLSCWPSTASTTTKGEVKLLTLAKCWLRDRIVTSAVSHHPVTLLS